MRRLKQEQLFREKGRSKPFSEQITPIIKPMGATMRYIGLRFLIICMDGSMKLAKFGKRFSLPVVYVIIRITKKFFLTSILHGYFIFLKSRKKIRASIAAGRHTAIRLFNMYMYKVTIAVIILLTLGYNLGSRHLNAEELRSTLIVNEVMGNSNEDEMVLIEEGPLAMNTTAASQNYLSSETDLSEDYILGQYEPGTDDDDLYATTDGEGAIVAPIITDPNAVTPEKRDRAETYIVEAGDTISTIAQKFGVSSNTILWQNDLTWNSTIKPGQTLTVLPVSGVEHTVKNGETVSAIAKKYQVDEEDIIAQNKLADAGDIGIDDKLIIPDGIKPTAITLKPKPKNLPSAIKDIFVPGAPASQDTGATMLWPVGSKRITQYFHLRHSGLDIGDKNGKPIYAAEAGKVERAGWTNGYGYNVIINHGNGLKTLYGHSSKLLVKVGDTVSRGDTIALVGSTGWSTGPHVHFEVFVKNSKVNPLTYIR